MSDNPGLTVRVIYLDDGSVGTLLELGCCNVPYNCFAHLDSSVGLAENASNDDHIYRWRWAKILAHLLN